MNFSEKCSGKWTHEIRTTGAVSVIDYIAVDSNVEKNVTSVLIDESGSLCPFRVTQKNGIKTTTLSDHNPMMMEIQIPRCKPAQQKHTPKWIIKPEGYTTMEGLFDNHCNKVAVDPAKTQETYDRYEKMIEETLDKSFRKTKMEKQNRSFKDSVNTSLKPLCKKLNQFASRGKAQRKVALHYRSIILQMNSEKVSTMNAQRLLKSVENLSENDIFSAQNFYKARKAIQSSIQSCNSVFDHTGKEVFETEDIIEVYRKEFDDRLTSVQINPALQNFKERTEDVCAKILEVARTKKQPDFTRKELDKVIDKLQQGKAHGPDRKPAEIFKQGGEEFRRLTLDVLNCIKISHVIPEQWERMNITPLYKGKGSRKHLVNQRGIFLTQVISKIWERLIKARTSNITENINKLQGGSRHGKGTPDQVFLMRSWICHARYLNFPLYLNFYDFKQCFDKIWLHDSIIALYKLGLNNEHLAHIYDVNSRAQITVNTPHGPSKTFTKTAIVKQGSVTAGSLCSATTGEFCDEHTSGGVQVGGTKINALAYVDDLTTANVKASDATHSNKKVCFFSDKKKQPLNEDKCFLLPLFLKQSDPIPTQLVNGKAVKIKDKAPYLGDIFNNRGTYKDLIDDRAKKARVCTINAMSQCSTYEMGKYTLNSLLLLYKTVFIRTILHNSEAWDNIPQNELDKLHSSQMKYLKWMLHSPRGTPNATVMLEVGVLPIKHEIDTRKLMFLHHILNLEPDDPVRRQYYEQQKFIYEYNWGNEIQTILQLYNISHSAHIIQQMSRDKWKLVVKRAITQHALTELLNKYATTETKHVTGYAELQQQEYFKYLSPQDARTCFQLRSGVYNIKHNRPYMYNDSTCRLCLNGEEDVYHIVNVCHKVNRNQNTFVSIGNLSEEETREMVYRVNAFKVMLDQKDDDEEDVDEEP